MVDDAVRPVIVPKTVTGFRPEQQGEPGGYPCADPGGGGTRAEAQRGRPEQKISFRQKAYSEERQTSRGMFRFAQKREREQNPKNSPVQARRCFTCLAGHAWHYSGNAVSSRNMRTHYRHQAQQRKREHEPGVLIGVRGICRYCKIGPRTFYKWRDHDFPATVSPDGRWMTSKALIDLWIIQHFRVQTRIDRGATLLSQSPQNPFPESGRST